MKYIFLFENDIQRRFICDYLSKLQLNLPNTISTLSGPEENSSITRKIIQVTPFVNQIKQNLNAGIKPVLFVDAGKNKSEVNEEFYNLRVNHNLDFDFFLFPNNQNSGSIIDLIEGVVNKNHSLVINCVEKYFNCVKSLNNKDYVVPAMHAKMVSYIEILQNISGTSNTLLRNVNYTQSELWDLNSNSLIPLKEFLKSLVIP